MPRSAGSWFQHRFQRSLRQTPIAARQTPQGQDPRPSSHSQSRLRRRLYFLRNRRKPTSGRPIHLSFTLDGQRSNDTREVDLLYDRHYRYFSLSLSIFRAWRSISSSCVLIDTHVMTSLAKCCCQSTKLWRKWQIQSIPTILQTTETTLVLYYSEILRHAVIRWAPSCWKRERKMRNHEMPRSQRGVWLLGRHANNPAAFVKVIDLFSFFWKPSK